MRDFNIRHGRQYYDKYTVKANRNKSCPTCGTEFIDNTANNLKIYCKRSCDINYKIGHNLRSRLNQAIKGRNNSLTKDLDCSIPNLKLYLESKWQQGMTWGNYGIDGWHIDHIKPLSKFDLRNPEELKKACHYTNLQPLWAKDNLSKNGTYYDNQS